MFEIRAIVADKKLHEVLRLLKPLTLEPPVSLPIENQVEKKPTGNSTELLAAFIKGKKTVSTREMRRHLEDQGWGKNSYSYGLQILIKRGDLRKTKTPTIYEVVSK